jgi:hypothetical protein
LDGKGDVALLVLIEPFGLGRGVDQNPRHGDANADGCKALYQSATVLKRGSQNEVLGVSTSPGTFGPFGSSVT